MSSQIEMPSGQFYGYGFIDVARHEDVVMSFEDYNHFRHIISDYTTSSEERSHEDSDYNSIQLESEVAVTSTDNWYNADSDRFVQIENSLSDLANINLDYFCESEASTSSSEASTPLLPDLEENCALLTNIFRAKKLSEPEIVRKIGKYRKAMLTIEKEARESERLGRPVILDHQRACLDSIKLIFVELDALETERRECEMELRASALKVRELLRATPCVDQNDEDDDQAYFAEDEMED